MVDSSVILMHSAAAFHVVRFAGACYLVWLGVQSLYGAARGGARGPSRADGTESRATPGAVSPGRCFLEGFLGNVLNPKVAVSVVLDQTRRVFLRSAVRRWLDGLCGALLVGLGVRLALERR